MSDLFNELLKTLHSEPTKEELHRALQRALNHISALEKKMELAGPLLDAVKAVARKTARAEVDYGPTKYK